MKWLLLKAKAKTAIAIPRRFEAGNLYESRMEIPKTTVRGAFAAAYLNRGKSIDNKFRLMFENHLIRFGPLRPLAKEIENFHDFVPVMPVPKSAQSCKYDDGLPEKGHGVRDLLFELASEVKPSEKGEINCTDCGAPIEPLDKPWLVSNWSQSLGIVYKPDFRLNTHVGLGAVGTEEMGVAMEGRLFSLQCFPQGTKFCGWIAINENEIDLESFLKELGFEANEDRQSWNLTFNLRVGRRSSTYGALEVEAKVNDEPPWCQTHGNFDERWEKFQKGFWERFKSPEKLKLDVREKSAFPDGYVFSVAFVTDTILIDQFLRPYRILTASEVANRLLIPESKVKLLTLFAQTQVIRGWNNAHRLPKEQDLAIVAGSVFLIIVQRDGINENELKQKLKEWEEKGIGWRKSEGFGQVLICDPWHVSQDENGLVPLRWKASREKLETKRKKLGEFARFDEQIVKFVEAIEGKVDLTKTQLQNLRALARIIDATYRHPFEKEMKPCERLKHHLEHQRDRKIKGWSQEIQWKGEKTKLADGLIGVLELASCNWEVALQRLEQFVHLMLASIEGKTLDKNFKVSKVTGRDEP